MRPRMALALTGALAFQGLSGLAGGVGRVLDPTGETLTIPLAWLDGSVLPDYMIPGVVLLMLLGIAPLVVAHGV